MIYYVNVLYDITYEILFFVLLWPILLRQKLLRFRICWGFPLNSRLLEYGFCCSVVCEREQRPLLPLTSSWPPPRVLCVERAPLPVSHVYLPFTRNAKNATKVHQRDATRLLTEHHEELSFFLGRILVRHTLPHTDTRS